MATMIAVITTDANIKPHLLQRALNEAVEDTFNMITVDNEMSTNDCVFVLANGISSKITDGQKYNAFVLGLKKICEHLAREIVRDGEGANKLITIIVEGAFTKEDARSVAKSIAGSNLLKCAVFGADPNVGRVLSAAGNSRAKIEQDKIDVYLNDIMLVKKGNAVSFNLSKASQKMKEKEVFFTVNLNLGKYSATAWGCDMTEGYIEINAKYHT